MQIWVDADACPNMIKEIIYRASQRTKIKVVLVANAPLRVPTTGLVSAMQVPKGFDVADDAIVNAVESGDLVITADIPLANAVLEKNAHALNPRGELYTKENIKDRLSSRDLMEQLRDSGLVTGGPKPLGPKDKQVFANALDRFLARRDTRG